MDGNDAPGLVPGAVISAHWTKAAIAVKADRMADPFILDDFLPYRLAVLAGRVSRDFAGRYREQFGLDRAEWRVLAHLGRDGAVSVREIHQRADMDKSKVSRAATRLEAAGLVAKRIASNDRRLVELTLTAKGQDMIDALTPLAQAYQRELLLMLGDNADPFLAGVKDLSRGVSPD